MEYPHHRQCNNVCFTARRPRRRAIAAVPHTKGHVIKTSVSFLYLIGRGGPAYPPPFPYPGKGGGSGGYPRRLPENSTTGAGQAGDRRKRRAFRPATPAVQHKPRRRGYITAEPIPSAGRVPLNKVSRGGASHLSSSCFFSGFASSGDCFSFHSSSRGYDLLLHFGGVTSLPKYLLIH